MKPLLSKIFVTEGLDKQQASIFFKSDLRFTKHSDRYCKSNMKFKRSLCHSPAKSLYLEAIFF
ncbi:hypothetical protein D7V32_13825 [Acinetobacter tianfuensis]|uniref:Uncharacterized protein n=1 Tax=Acinetobacter tianfuensis TaxID=2419603 RepID=A0A3A8EN01_9GAMM|nr:hypothetical protein D7V32_13825 [Acinetobacter tianfuensis]